MLKKKYGLAIVNRSFWPQSAVLGEAKLQLAERVATSSKVCVITQSEHDLTSQARSSRRGKNVRFLDCKSLTDSSSNLAMRVVDSLFFGFWLVLSLIRTRPAVVYVSTNPPVLIPFIVFLYSKVFRAKYCYHLQDIHPEITNIVVPLNRHVYRLLQKIDSITMRHASCIVTLSQTMADYIRNRSGAQSPIHLVTNPSFKVDELLRINQKTSDVVFCGNAGRLQRIPLLIDAIDRYHQKGGKLSFTFAGGGVFAPEIQKLDERNAKVKYLGYVHPREAAKLVAQHKWALLPLEDEVTQYAFPSKSSSYVQSGCGIIAVCGFDNSLASWVQDNDYGEVVEPSIDPLVAAFEKLEERSNSGNSEQERHQTDEMAITHFVERMYAILFGNECPYSEGAIE